MTMNGTSSSTAPRGLSFRKCTVRRGVFDHDKGKSHSSGKLLFAARIIPYRGSWLDIEFDAKDIVHARIDRRRKIPATSILYALGMDGEEILSIFYKTITFRRDKDGWRLRFEPERMKGMKAALDILDADTGEVVLEAGKNLPSAPRVCCRRGGQISARAG
jgi:DNA-directed RNA polymerase subunit beta